MKKSLLLLALVQGIALSAFAQTPAAPADAGKTRAEVKTETKAANKAGDLKGGDVAPIATSKMAATPADAGKTRADVKTETKAANKAGDLKGGDVAPTATSPMAAAPAADGKSRADVKAETKAANKAGELRKNGDIGEQPAPVVKKRSKKMRKMAKPADATADAPAK